MPVRRARSDDVARLVEINNAEVPAVGEIDRAALAHLLEQSCVSLVATVDGDEPAGFCIVLPPGADYGSVNYRWFAERYDDFVYLDRVAIVPSAQGRGLGRALYDEVERLVDATWFTLEVNVRPRNDGSLAFHDRLGFVEVGQQETPYGARVSLMAKRLR